MWDNLNVRKNEKRARRLFGFLFSILMLDTGQIWNTKYYSHILKKIIYLSVAVCQSYCFLITFKDWKLKRKIKILSKCYPSQYQSPLPSVIRLFSLASTGLLSKLFLPPKFFTYFLDLKNTNRKSFLVLIFYPYSTYTLFNISLAKSMCVAQFINTSLLPFLLNVVVYFETEKINFLDFIGTHQIIMVESFASEVQSRTKTR